MGKCLPCEQIKNGIKKATNITKAWINVINNDPIVETLAEQRMIQCNYCNSRVEMLKVNNTSVYKCKECSCPLMALVRSDEKCKLNKW